MEHINPAVYVELGAAGFTLIDIDAMIARASRAADDEHKTGAQGRVTIPKIKRVLVYDSGIDGMDWKVFLEDEPVKTADELIQEAVGILTRHRNRPAYSNLNGPNMYAWEKDALRYLKARSK